jgi:ppGpp synthetase/RelA/SpoT-type nucleotidyltranferase
MSKPNGNISEFVWAKNQIQTYCKRYPDYEDFAEVLQKILEDIAKKYAPLAIVQTRPKSVSSFGEKIWRKSDPTKDPVNEFTDLCGGRVITHTSTEVNAICNFIKKNFEVDKENSINPDERLKPTEFGYHSVHFIVSFKPKHFPTKEVNVKVPKTLLGLKAEIQVKTLLEHAWADFSHDRSYKSQFTVPTKWQRELATIAANLEAADNDFVRIESGLAAYATSYGTYMTKEEMQSQIKKLELVLEFDESNLEIAHRIGKLAMTLGDWEKAVTILSKYTKSNSQPLLKDLGVSICHLYKKEPDGEEYAKGQTYLQIACELSDSDSDAFASLAGTYRRKNENKAMNEKKAKELYFEAFKRDPSNSYPLGNYVDYYISQSSDPDSINLINPILEASIQKCREQAEVGINLPWAYYDMAKFSLLLGKPYESLTYYAKAISTSTASWMISTTLTSLNRTAKFWEKKEGFEWIQKLLLLGLFTKTNDKQEKEDCIARIKDQSTNTQFLQPVIIVAGNGITRLPTDHKKYQTLMQEGFRDFTGTIISGGTNTGVSNIAGKIAKKYKINAIGYIPNLKQVPNIEINNNYIIKNTEGNDFSPLEPLQYWVDIIASGIEPAEMKLLGIGGGQISAVEYRIALALGAIVASVDESGGEASRLFFDGDWAESPNLICLPDDRETLHAFTSLPKSILNLQMRETLAKAIHDQYRKTVAGSHLSSDPAMAIWEKLSHSLTESNLQQADAIFEKLKRIKCVVQEVANRPVALMTFTEKEIEIMAEMEHGRWNVERLLKGWRQAKTRNVDKKQTPYIVSWVKLPLEVKKWDKETVNKIPDFLAQVGLEIQRIK